MFRNGASSSANSPRTIGMCEILPLDDGNVSGHERHQHTPPVQRSYGPVLVDQLDASRSTSLREVNLPAQIGVPGHAIGGSHSCGQSPKILRMELCLVHHLRPLHVAWRKGLHAQDVEAACVGAI